ncbi:ParB/RepB/Spo0J family partition protein [Tahibacter caeni]|uniref:ParB/RepB/Spo0J family partition protein n=1 Tax=Tahibacter caeni TaxID=1453545 RepID=UPI0021485ED1|nr:ParB/RepB/Spo0J family partition protein [Tahibacter caeni]
MTTSISHTPSTLPLPVPAQHLLLVPLSLLRPSSRNVRRAGAIGIAELAASIARVGLLQNLTVTLACDGEHYEVVAGSRRLAALKLLAKQHRITKDAEVPCLMVADVSARTASLTENLQREAMHPADQFAAFAALVAEGRTVEEIAADFAVTPLVVQRRLKLANISPRLMADYRAGEIALDQLMALAITDEHEAQEASYYNAPSWNRDPQALRARLTEQEIDACRNPLAQFVGLEAYEKAGGGTRRDLFADADHGIYLSDNALLYRLAQERLDAEAHTVRAEGWAWVDAVPTITSADLHAFQRAPMQAREPRAGETKRIAALQAKMQQLGAAIEEALEAGDDARADALHEQGERAGERLQAIERGLMDYSAATRAMSGAIVTIGRRGEIVIHRGLMREAEAKAMRLLAKARDGAEEPEADDAEGAASTPRLSETLTRRLSAHRTAALRVELARSPHTALAALVCHLLEAQEHPVASSMPLCIGLRPQRELDAYAPDMPEAPATAALQELRAALTGNLPEDGEARFAYLLGLEQDALLHLLALCVASSLNAVTSRADEERAAPLAQAVALDMSTWWTPTAEGYFRHIPKTAIAEAVREFAPQHAARLTKLTKAGSASEAERLVAGTGWLPAMLRAATSDTPTA